MRLTDLKTAVQLIYCNKLHGTRSIYGRHINRSDKTFSMSPLRLSIVGSEKVSSRDAELVEIVTRKRQPTASDRFALLSTRARSQEEAEIFNIRYKSWEGWTPRGRHADGGKEGERDGPRIPPALVYRFCVSRSYGDNENVGGCCCWCTSVRVTNRWLEILRVVW